MIMIRRWKVQEEQDRLSKKPEGEKRAGVSSARPVHPVRFGPAMGGASSLSPSDILRLQRTIGNQAVGQLIGKRWDKPVAGAVEQSIQRSVEEEEELPCPGSKISSGGLGKGEGYGQGKGPVGYPKDEEWT
jgi:hypothetical protein